MTLEPVTPRNAEEATEQLVDTAGALFFEIDRETRVKFRLARKLGHERPALKIRAAEQARFPDRRYDRDALALYFHARDNARSLFSSGLLTSYLAFYQVVEFYMPAYSRADTLRQFKALLAVPVNDPDNDLLVGRLLGLAAKSSRSPNERSQLKATIAACVPEDDLRQFLTGRPELATKLEDKNYISAVTTIHPADRGTPLVAQISDRIYDIRCRIVHSKDTTETARPRVLLPSSEESHRLHHDIDLVQYISEQVITMTSRPFEGL